MADLRIVDAPEIPTEDITGQEKLPTGGSGNYSITLDSVADYTKNKKDLANNTSVDVKVNGVRQELESHIEDLLNPHQVTKGQIGLGNVDNTADADKPVSNSTQAAIISAVAPKADKNYVETQLALKANKVDVDSSLINKVDKTYVDNQLAVKSDKTYVDNQLTLKSDKTEIIEQLSLKSDKIYVDDQLSNKSDKTYTDSQLLLKADKTYVDSQDSALQSQINQKATAEYLDNALTEQTNTVNTALSNLSTAASKFYPTLAEANADIANITVNQVVNVGESANGGLWYKATVGATSLTKSAYDPLTQAKNYTDSYATVKAKTLANAADFNTLNVEGRYIVPSNAAALTMVNCPWGRAGVLEVLPVSNTLVIQRYTTYGIEKKLFYRASNAGVWSATWDEYLLKSVADGIYSTPATVAVAVADSSSALTSTLVQADYYGKKYTTAEQTGAGLYTNAVVAGYNSIHTKDVTFNSVNARIFNTTAGKIEYRVWMGSKLSSTVNGYRVSTQATIANPDFSGHCGYFPNADDGIDTIILDKAVSIPKNTPFVIAFKAIDSTRFSIAYASSATGNLESRSFNLATTTGDWTTYSQIANADVASGYIQAGFKLLVTLPQQSSSDDYLPEIVLPPVIYAMQRTKTSEIDQTLETRIYPEHIIREDYKLYDHDVTCTKGQQRNRGFVWNASQSDAIGSYPLSWALQDKRTNKQLTTASTTIKLAALNAKSGTTQKVQVIGDSLVNAGAITQRLLDIAADDVMKIELIGTRGSGLNKHEGRGGWRINEYTGVGLSNYKFTVSGVVTVPAINSATYSFNGVTYLVQETAISGGSGYIICSVWSGTAPANPSGSGTLTKANTGVGDVTIAFSNFETVSGNPFWNTSTTQIDYANYLSRFSLAAPNYVFIQLGTNDVFGITSDALVEPFCATAFPKLDILINSIKASIAGVKVVVVAPPVGADQDAFGTSYATGQTARRFKRNMVTYNKQLYNYYGGKEAQSIYVVGSGVGVDTENNFPTTSQKINTHNSTLINAQSNGVHPDISGYYQISDNLFPFIKAV